MTPERTTAPSIERADDPILHGSAQRDVRRLTRACQDYRRLARRAEALPPEATVTRIAGEPVVGDLGERGMVRVGLLMARNRVAFAVEQLVEGIRILNGERPWKDPKEPIDD